MSKIAPGLFLASKETEKCYVMIFVFYKCHHIKWSEDVKAQLAYYLLILIV